MIDVFRKGRMHGVLEHVGETTWNIIPIWDLDKWCPAYCYHKLDACMPSWTFGVPPFRVTGQDIL
jgi:hypothetical protein